MVSEAPVDNGGKQAKSTGVPPSATQPSEASLQDDSPQPVRRRSAGDGGVKLPSPDSNKKDAC